MLTRKQLSRLIELAFDSTAMEDAFVEAIQDYIDYDAIAKNLLDQHPADIEDIVQELAEQSF